MRSRIQPKAVSSKGGTGNFEISVVNGVNTIDANLIFGTAGIGPATESLTSFVVTPEGGVARSNSQKKYVFSFTTQVGIEKTSFIKIRIPKGVFSLGAKKQAILYDDARKVSRQLTITLDGDYISSEKVGVYIEPSVHLNLEMALVTSVVYSVG
jgi:hypothetical protein